MKKALAIVTLSTLFSVTADLQAQPLVQNKQAADAPSPAPQDAGGAAAPASPDKANNADSDSNDDPLPSVELTDDLMFKLLRAELAEQRGDWQLAYVTMLLSAQQTRDPRLARRAAEIALTARQVNEALSAVRLWRELAPHSDEADQFYLGLVMLEGNLAEAKSVLVQRLQEVKPQARGLLIMQIQRLLSRVNDKAAAFALLEEIAGPYQTMYETHIALSQGAFAMGDLSRAHSEAQIALKMKPDLELAALMLAQSTKDRSEALQILKSFLDANPRARDARIAYAKVLIDDKQASEAQAQLDILLKNNPDDLTALYALGVLSAQTNNFAMAEKYLTDYLKALDEHPEENRDSTQALQILTQISLERKDYPGALKWLAQIDRGPAYIGAQIQSALIMATAGDVEGARSLLHRLKPIGQRDQTQIVVAEAQILRDAKRMPEALNVMKKGVDRFPDDTSLLYDYAMLAERAERLDLMEPALRKVIKLAPENQHAYNALGYAFADRHMRLPEALALIQKALQLAPEDPFIMDSMGWVQFRLGHLKEAEDYLRRAYALRPDVEIATHLGEVLWAKGEKGTAQELWREANQKDPQNDTLKSTLARLHVNL
ncbi:MAG TPA: tetratricopeptide repeat protein [Oxalicibacterium sp.]|nr:tetratricopeptide repeat protein [Oxalicibacterium sp.]